MSISCAPTLKSNSSLIYRVPSWLGVTGTIARWVFKESWIWDINKLQAARGLSCEIIVTSWTRSSTVRVTESDPKSRDHSKPSLETEKIKLVYCRLKVNKKRREMNFLLTASTNWESTQSCHKWNVFCLFWLWFGCAWLRLADEFLLKGGWFLFFVVAARFSWKALCTITTKQYNGRFLVFRSNIQNVTAGCALFGVVETSHFIGWNVNTFSISTCRTIHISISVLYFVVLRHFFLSEFV